MTTDDGERTSQPDRRLLLVHAHPDDETIGTGATMARYAADGVQVTLVTCTRGEEGEVLVPALAHLAADRDDALGEHREGELASAMRRLGVSDHRFLGGAGRWRDSGMMGLPTNDRDDSFWRADLLEAATALVEVVREVRPQVVVTYDEDGGYGHPDHVQAHRVTTYAVALAAVPSFRPDLGPEWDVPKVYWAATPRSAIQQGIDAMVAAGGKGFFGLESAEDAPFAVDDALVTTAIDARRYAAAKLAALAEHATQIEADGDFAGMVEALGVDAMGVEHYRIAKGAVAGATDDDGWETDLFAGVPQREPTRSVGPA